MVSGNLLKEEVRAVIREAFNENERDDICTCEQCYKDVLAISLTKLRPRYAGSEEGEVVLKSVDISSDQTRLDILRVVHEAIDKVNENPHHDEDR